MELQPGGQGNTQLGTDCFLLVAGPEHDAGDVVPREGILVLGGWLGVVDPGRLVPEVPGEGTEVHGGDDGQAGLGVHREARWLAEAGREVDGEDIERHGPATLLHHKWVGAGRGTL